MIRRSTLSMLALVLAGAGCGSAPAAPGTPAAPGSPPEAAGPRPAAPSPAPAAPVPAETAVAGGHDMLHRALDSIATEPPLHRTHWGVHIVDAASGAVLYSRNAERHFIPASNMKLVVAATALALFGEEFRYETAVYARGRMADAATSIVVVGSGDPSWSTRFHDHADAPLDSLAMAVAAAGVRSAGELVVDASLFTDAAVFGAWEVADLPWQYAPPTAPFALADGTFTLVMSGATAPGLPATVHNVGPVPQPIRVAAMTDTVGARATLTIDYTSRRDTVYGTGAVGPGVTDTSTLAVTRPAHSAAAAFVDALRRHGVTVDSFRVVADTVEAAALLTGAQRIGVYRSAPMREIVATILQPSQNWVAEQVLKTLGAHFGEEGSWSGGNEVAANFLYDDVAIDSGAVNLRDASGMSPQNLLTPEAIVELLQYARAQHWGDAWYAALAAPGVEGSTLSSRLPALEGRLAGKTGTISNVNSLSGYLAIAGGRPLIFSIMTNGTGLPASRVRAAMDSMVVSIDRHAAHTR